VHDVAELVRDGHGLPQLPQFATLTLRSTSQPFDATPSQLPRPVLQVPSTHAPPVHDAPANGKLQAFPQLPQFATDEESAVSQPFVASPSQLPKPALHEPTTHAPPLHEPAAFGYEHPLPHAPQFVASVFRFASHPFADEPSQLPKPDGHVAVTHDPATHA
jgi:hypothetical protein